MPVHVLRTSRSPAPAINSTTPAHTSTLTRCVSLTEISSGFSYTKDTHEAKLGPIELSVQEKETVNVPMWAGVGAIAIGGAILFFGTKTR